MRDWVLGLTVVTGTGEVLELNGDLFKNNTGYDLRGLVCGSEGTLAIITAATLKLTDPLPPAIRVVCGLADSSGIGDLLAAVRGRYPGVGLFEYFSGLCLDVVVRHTGARPPFPTRYPGYVIFEVAGDAGAPNDALIDWLGELTAAGRIVDAVVGRSIDQGRELLGLRESISATLSKYYTLHKNDIAVPVQRMGSFLSEIETFVAQAYPTAHCALFGHVADGNIHVNILKPDGVSTPEFTARAHAVDADLFALVRAARGTISAEHGVGLLKRDFLHFTRSQAEIEILRGIKRIFDPHGILNPGKIFAAEAKVTPAR
jgi:FAD/FMN-containing dehydrogenase